MKKGLKIAFLLYMAMLLYFLLFSERSVDVAKGYNLIPFAEIRRYLHYGNVLGARLVILNLVGNVAGFMPLGFFVPTLKGTFQKLWRTTLLVAGFSLTMEGIQYVTRLGCFDVDDIILNTLGGILGYCLWKIFPKVRLYDEKKTK